jgi:hypothetical protein
MFNLRGPVRYFVFDPSDPEIVYANSTALFKSNDRGKTWNVYTLHQPLLRESYLRGDHADEVIVTPTVQETVCFLLQSILQIPGNSMQ